MSSSNLQNWMQGCHSNSSFLFDQNDASQLWFANYLMDIKRHVPLRILISVVITTSSGILEKEYFSLDPHGLLGLCLLGSFLVHSPTQLKNGSFLHWLEQPSPFMVFLSSHCSPWDLGIKGEEELIQSSKHVIIITVWMDSCLIIIMKLKMCRINTPLDDPISTVWCSKMVEQRRRRFTVSPSGDRLNLVGVHHPMHHVPKHTKKEENKYNNIIYCNIINRAGFRVKPI